MTPLPGRALAPCLTALLLTACGGSVEPTDASPGDIGTLPPPRTPAGTVPLGGAPDAAPGDIAVETGGAGLVFATEGACGNAGQEITARLLLRDDAPPGTSGEASPPDGQTQQGIDGRRNITDVARFDQGLGDSIELVSRPDGAIVFALDRPDIVALVATLPTADGATATLTNYFSAWPEDAPASAALRKPAPVGCLWALRLAESDGDGSYCASGYPRGAAGRLGLPGRHLEVAGCEAVNESGLPIIDLPPVGTDAGA